MGRSKKKEKAPPPQQRRYSRRLKVKAQAAYNRSITSLPDEMLVEIFDYLGNKDKCQARLVCNRWDYILRDKRYWNPVTRSIKTLGAFVMDIALLPSFLSHIKLICWSVAVPFGLPEIMAKFHESCISLKTLIIENIRLTKNFHALNKYRARELESFNAMLFQEAKSSLKESFLQFLVTEYVKEETELGCTVMPELKVLSLRGVMFNESHFFSQISPSVLPKITVLDLSFTKPISLSLKTCDLFSKMFNLEELYLAGWRIKDEDILNFIKKARKLRVLDLQICKITEATILALQENCLQLEELCVVCALIDHIRISSNERFFQQLHTLCVAETRIYSDNIENLLRFCPSLKRVNIDRCINISPYWYNGLNKEWKERIFDPGMYCNHFRNSRHYF